MIKANFKGFHFFDWEIGLLKEIGFEFPKLEKANELKDGRGNSVCTYKVLENPIPIEFTAKRKKLLLQLRFQMNNINIIFPSDKTGFRQIKAS